jgi:hypothetical protein
MERKAYRNMKMKPASLITVKAAFRADGGNRGAGAAPSGSPACAAAKLGNRPRAFAVAIAPEGSDRPAYRSSTPPSRCPAFSPEINAVDQGHGVAL